GAAGDLRLGPGAGDVAELHPGAVDGIAGPVAAGAGVSGRRGGADQPQRQGGGHCRRPAHQGSAHLPAAAARIAEALPWRSYMVTVWPPEVKVTFLPTFSATAMDEALPWRESLLPKP